MDAAFSWKGSINGSLHLCAHNKCPPFKHGIKESELAQWLGENTGLTSELVKEVIELFMEHYTEYTCDSTPWNEAARWANQKCKSCTTVGLGTNSISNLARKLCLVVYLMNSSVSVNTILMNICYLFNELWKKWINILYIGNDAHLLSECKYWRERIYMSVSHSHIPAYLAL